MDFDAPKKPIVLKRFKHTKKVITARDISIGYHKKAKEPLILAQEVNFTLVPGQLTAIIGPNGCGKSTLLNTLSGQLEPLQGTILIDDKPVAKVSPFILSKYLALVMTKKEFSQQLSVLEFVKLGRIPYTNWLGSLGTEDHKAVERAIVSTQITELQHQKCGILSDGQMQRVSIARALAQDTPIILLDEPTTHLDLVNKAQTLKLLKNLAQQHNKAIAYATHDIELALDLANQIICVSKQKITAGSPEQIIDTEVINQMFESHLVRFDPKTKRFSIRD